MKTRITDFYGIAKTNFPEYTFIPVRFLALFILAAPISAPYGYANVSGTYAGNIRRPTVQC